MSNWFSNFLPFDQPLVVEGIEFTCVETYYQAMKSEDKEDWKKIAAMTASQSKYAGRKVKIRKDWESIKDDVMLTALLHKFGRGTTWRQKLKDTTGEIVEWNYWHDNYWGRCTCPACANVKKKNMLGVLLMRIREYLVTGKTWDVPKP